jgi:histone chaperone ASF1
VVLLICSYLSQEFVRIGYYLDNDFEEESMRENPPSNMAEVGTLALLKRNILVDKPRVTRFNIRWDPNKLNEEEDISELLHLKVDDQDDDDWSDSHDDEDEEEDEEDKDITESEMEDESHESKGMTRTANSTDAIPSDAMMDVEPVLAA